MSNILNEFNIYPGMTFTNQDLMDKFQVANSGGMRRSLKNNVLILIKNTIDSIYDDQWKDGELHYTGMGQSGDQSLNFGQNKTLSESRTNGVRVLLFESTKPKEYLFKGQVALSREPYTAIQTDKDNRKRKVIIFPLKLI